MITTQSRGAQRSGDQPPSSKSKSKSSSLMALPDKMKSSFSKRKNSTETSDLGPDADYDPANEAPGVVRQSGQAPPLGLENEAPNRQSTTTASATSPGSPASPIMSRQRSNGAVSAQAQGAASTSASAPGAATAPAPAAGPPRPSGPLAPGLVGLYNIGNTCFMNSALNCLLHTPLLSGYLISGKYISHINRDNRLGTGGRLTEELARLFNELWSPRLKPVSPVSFKKCLEVTKPIFSGNDQHDAQEFLVELIDTIHEDINDRAGGVSRSGKGASSPNDASSSTIVRTNVVHHSTITLDFASEVNNDILLDSPDAISSAELKSIRPEYTFDAIGSYLDTDVAMRMTSEELAKYYWDRHLSRNSSVVVDLVQGQLRNEVECPSCTTVTQTFDPFSCVSVPIPKQHHERQIVVVLFRRMPWLMNAFKTNKMLVSSRIMSINDLTEAYVKIHRLRRRARRSCVTLSRLNEVCDLKQSICDDYNQELVGEGGTTNRDSLSGGTPDSGHLLAKQLLLCEYKNSKLCKALEDRNPVANLEMLVNPENPMSLCCFSFESNIDVPFITSAPGDMLSGRHSSVSSRPISSSGDKGSMVTDAWFKLRDREDYESGLSTTTSGRTVVDVVAEDALPSDYGALLELVKRTGPYGVRLDAMDKKGKWFSGCIVACSLRANRETYDPVDYEIAVRNAKVLVHFDYFSSKWDEVMSINDFKNGRMAPLYSRCRRKIAVFEVRVVMRYPAQEEAVSVPAIPAAGNAPLSPRTKNSILDALNPSRPFVPSSKTAAPAVPQPSSAPAAKAEPGTPVFEPEVAQTFVLQLESFRSCENAYRHIVDQVASRYLSEDEIRAYLRESLAGGGPSVADAKLPFDVRMVTSTTVKAPGLDYSHGYTWATQQLFDEDHKPAWDGTQFPRDDKRPLCNVYHNKFVVTVDWKTPARRPLSSSEPSGASQSSSSSSNKVFAEYRDTPSYLTAIRNAKPLPAARPAPATSTSSSSSASSPSPSAVVDVNEVSLEDCLRSYSCDEILDEDTWFCSMCQAHRKGVTRASFYRLPDIFIVHVKRFNMTARWREKIRTKVVFPIDGLDMNDFLSGPSDNKSRGAMVTADGSTELSEANNNSNNRENNVYDLYSVINHLGGMSGGHYTAAVRYYGYPTDAESHSSPPVRRSNASPKPPAAAAAPPAPGASFGATNSTEGSASVKDEGGKMAGFLSGLLCRGSFADVLKGAASDVGELGSKVHRSLSAQQRRQVDASVGQWYLVDDDIVSPIDADKVVSPNAYVLFYRRRKLSPANVQSMSATV